LLSGHFFVTGQALEAQATKLGSQGPTAGNILPTEGRQAERRGFPEQGEDPRPFPQQAPRHRGGEFAQATRHILILNRLREVYLLSVEKNIRTISRVGSGISGCKSGSEAVALASVFGIRISFGFRYSGFGFGISRTDIGSAPLRSPRDVQSSCVRFIAP
jgi:hypothetical protein